jgi:pilus assembly protein CpaE
VDDRATASPKVSTRGAAPVAMVYVGDKDTEGLLRQSLNGLNIQTPYFGSGGIAGAIEELASRASPRLLIVDISGAKDGIASIRELSQVCEPGTGVIVVGDDNDIILYRDLKNIGIAEYFFKPLIGSLVTRACKAILVGTFDERVVRTGKLVHVLGVRGGAGNTTVATRLAWHLSQVRKRRAIYVDFDLIAGDAALQFDVVAQHALSEALEHPERVDDLFLERAVSHVTERLDLLASTEPLDSVINYTEAASMSLISRLLRSYRYVFTDLSTERAASMPRILHLPCICVLVSTASLASARDISRWRALIGPDTADRKTMHILDKISASDGLSVADFERATGHTPDALITYDRDVARSSSLGITALEKCEGFFKALGPILQEISGEPTKPERSLISRMFG